MYVRAMLAFDMPPTTYIANAVMLKTNLSYLPFHTDLIFLSHIASGVRACVYVYIAMARPNVPWFHM